ncbi:glycosyltransferase family 2 protein [Nodosilinea nodulosa]|uniref:glycosyltransferase family 2 protein n=1 Tax=Nodosilinea nodulosa TaxID=416001 RepID=UPI0002D3AD00|nr:glycosyltransferase [Nodosilinea nodulosa]
MNNLEDPLVSVVIPAYNAADFIGQTLRSVVAQTYRHLEIIVVDDGSCDRTQAIVQGWMQQEPHIKLLHQANAGVAAARNLGIENARGQFIAPLDADDVWHPHAIEKLVSKFQASSATVGVIYAWSVDIDQNDRPTGSFHAARIAGDVYKTLICHNFLGNASSTLIRKACLDQTGGYDVEFMAQNSQGCEDWDLYLRLAKSYDFAVVPEFLIGYRKIQSSMSRNHEQMARSHQLMLQKNQQKSPDLPSYFYRLSCSSFYLYLAQQCSASENSRDTLSWLWRAVKIDPITPLGRLSFYMLLIKSLLKLSQKMRPAPLALTKPRHLASKGPGRSMLVPGTLLPFYLPVHPLKIQLKLLAGTVLHQSLSRI